MVVQNDKFLKMLGLATRAGRLCFGEGAVSDSIRQGKASLVIVSADASENTKKKFGDSCSFYGTAIVEVADRYALGTACGRAFAVVISVCDEGFAKKLQEILHQC